MAWMARNVDVRCDPAKLLPGAQAVICVADFIGPQTFSPSPLAGRGQGGGASESTATSAMNTPSRTPPPDPLPADGEGETERHNPRTSDGEEGRIARYAQVDDYHKVMKKRLFALADLLRELEPGHEYRVCVDTAPLLEREFAARAGLGWVGKNTLLLHPRLGSHLLLGEIVTTLALPPGEPEPDHCGTCTRCIDACPTACITPYAVDASRCISYTTIEHREAIDPAMHEPTGEWLYGCDVCQEVCPFNAPDRPPTEARPPQVYRERPAALPLLEVLGWSDADRRAAFTRSAMKRAKLDQMKRNAAIAAGNALRRRDDAALRRRLETIASDEAESPLVRDAAAAALEAARSR